MYRHQQGKETTQTIKRNVATFFCTVNEVFFWQLCHKCHHFWKKHLVAELRKFKRIENKDQNAPFNKIW